MMGVEVNPISTNTKLPIIPAGNTPHLRGLLGRIWIKYNRESNIINNLSLRQGHNLVII